MAAAMQQVTTEEIVEDIRAVASSLGRSRLSRAEYVQRGKYSYYHLYDGGRTWEGLCGAAGIQTKKIEAVADEVYFSRLRDAVSSLGRLPNTYERKRFGLNFKKSRWPTLNAFIRAAAAKGVIQAPAVETPVEGKPSGPEKTDAPVEGVRPLASGTRPVPPIPAQTRRRKWQRTGIESFPYAPHDELGVVSLFAILCSQGHIPWGILELNSVKGIDVTCYDHKSNREIRVELKYLLSRSAWNHSTDDLDYVVCWENRWTGEAFPKPFIELRKVVEDLAT